MPFLSQYAAFSIKQACQRSEAAACIAPVCTHRCMALSTHVRRPVLLTATPKRLQKLLSVVGSETWLAIWDFNSPHSFAIDKGWVSDLPF